MPRTRTIQERDFSIGLLAGLRLHNINAVDDHDRLQLHRAIKDAFDVVDDQLKTTKVRFLVILDQIHGTSPTIDEIVNYWVQSGWATKDSPGTTYRFRMPEFIALSYLDEDVFGGKDLWIKAADAFLKNYRSA